MAVAKPDPEVVAWIERLCVEQGVEVKITDPEVVERVAALLRVVRHPKRPVSGLSPHG